MLTESTVVDRIEILLNGIVQIRKATIIFRNEDEISREYFRIVLSPGEDVSDMDERTQAVCGAVWTDEVVTAFQQAQNEI